MKETAFMFLLWMTVWDSATVCVTVSPDRSQFFKYGTFSVSCEDEDAGPAGWRVMKRMKDGQGRWYPSPWSVPAAFPATDSGVYWCESEQGAAGEEVNITVTDGPVILQTPVRPLTEGNNLTLNCRCQTAAAAGKAAADFYKDGVLVKTSLTRNMTIPNVSFSDQGLYRCEIVGLGESPESWLTVRAPPAGEDPPSLPSVLVLLRHLIVGTPYLLSTVLLGLIYNDRKQQRERRATLVTQTRDVIMQIVP
ncbi:low affinity immunoglobulin gamma Fc region receptor II-a-like [Cololabis saira]|uniref:low affinity immunoglobulin gamma Fc region receptor II-a-like n=1 Tax=Cololabis saira TaxID=129043 RepID=UPI002AD459D3|nr:low affinity immunoglobulin gamma Fc region receptor II-a-like [Cololabis saira]